MPAFVVPFLSLDTSRYPLPLHAVAAVALVSLSPYSVTWGLVPHRYL